MVAVLIAMLPGYGGGSEDVEVEMSLAGPSIALACSILRPVSRAPLPQCFPSAVQPDRKSLDLQIRCARSSSTRNPTLKPQPSPSAKSRNGLLRCHRTFGRPTSVLAVRSRPSVVVGESAGDTSDPFDLIAALWGGGSGRVRDDAGTPSSCVGVSAAHKYRQRRDATKAKELRRGYGRRRV